MSTMRATMCGDCRNFNTDNCQHLDKVKDITWIIMLNKECNFNSWRNKGKCDKCGKNIPNNKVRCECLFDGEYTD